MNWFISNFYNIRFFPKTMLPVSTCMWDPKWYKANPPVRDKRSVVIGNNCSLLHLPNSTYKKLGEPCSHENCGAALPCSFMKAYHDYLATVNFDALKTDLELLASKYDCDSICLMVAEHPRIVCAERPVLRGWFKAHGVDLVEFTKPVESRLQVGKVRL